MDETKLYGLLYYDEANNKNANLKVTVNPTDVYVSCASLCSKAFRAAGAVFGLITNNEEYVRSRFSALQLDDIIIVGHKFSLGIP
jgi:hypothetical protein